MKQGVYLLITKFPELKIDNLFMEVEYRKVPEAFWKHFAGLQCSFHYSNQN